MLTDVEGSTRSWQENPEGMKVAIGRHDEILANGIQSNGGLVLKQRGEGDSAFAVFARASNAVAAARDIQRALHYQPWPTGLPMRVRIAIHTGEAHEEALDDYRGPVVNRCARLRALARGGQVLISSSVRELVQDRLPEGILLKDLGPHQLRDLDRAERVYQVIDPELKVEAPPAPRPRLRLYGALAGVLIVAGAVVALAVLHLLAPAGPAITTVAGTGIDGDPGQTQRATIAEISRPAGVATDNFGNFYLAEGQRIREVTSDGTIRTVAGSGAVGFNGDGGQATLARLDLIQGGNLFGAAAGIAVDTAGVIYFADGYNQRVRKVTQDGIITTVAGRGTGIGGYAGDGGPATEALLNSPRGIVVDPFGGLYIADTENNRIRKVDVNGVITTVAGTGEPGPGGDGGLATLAQLSAPQGLALDLDGNLYIADTGNNRIRRVDANSRVITTIAGVEEAGYSGDHGRAKDARLNLPVSVAVSLGGVIYIADSQNNRIRMVDAAGNITTVAGTGSSGYSGDNSAAASAQLKLPLGVAVDLSGAVYIADSENNRVRRVH